MRRTTIIAILAAGLALSACMVNPTTVGKIELEDFVQNNARNLTAHQEPITHPIGLYEAMARAIKYNLDYRVEMMNQALAVKMSDLKSAAMLPDLVANTAYNGRSNSPGGLSRSIVTGEKTTDLATSDVKNHVTADIKLSWNILDFGLSYIRAKQASDEILIAAERRRKIINQIMEDVRTAYWRAVSGERLLGGLRHLEGRVNKVLSNSRSLSAEGALPPLTALTYQRELVDIRRQIHELEGDLRSARIQLSALMNVRPDADFKLVIPKRSSGDLKINRSARQLAEIALRNRPELREAFVKERITVREADAALLQMLPGIQIFGGPNIDSNNLLLHNNWISWGAQTSWNLMRVFQYPTMKAENSARQEVNRAQSMAMTMAVLTQVYVARARFYEANSVLKDAGDYSAIQGRILKQVRDGESLDSTSVQSLIREEMNALIANAKYDVAYANLQSAYALVFTSAGLDPYGPGINGREPVAQLARALQSLWLERGDGTSI